MLSKSGWLKGWAEILLALLQWGFLRIEGNLFGRSHRLALCVSQAACSCLLSQIVPRVSPGLLSTNESVVVRFLVISFFQLLEHQIRPYLRTVVTKEACVSHDTVCILQSGVNILALLQISQCFLVKPFGMLLRCFLP